MKPRLIAGAAGSPNGACDADIIILALDRADETVAAIRSACGQTGITSHVFVLDQGSCAETLQKLASAAGEYRNITLLAVRDNLGVAAGRNLVSALGHGRTIVGLDNDAEFAAPDTVARMVAALDVEPGLAAVGCRIVAHTGGADDLASWGYPSALLAYAGESFDAVTYVGAGHAIRRAAWDQAGGYDPRLFFCWEEFDFCLRAIALGWRVRYRGDIVIRHKTAAQQRLGWTAARWFYFVRNRLYIERKLGHGWLATAPRIGGYLLKGLRNRLLVQTIRAILAAATMGPRSRLRVMPPAGTRYLSRNDTDHRGSWPRRLMQEVLGRIGAPPGVAVPVKR